MQSFLLSIITLIFLALPLNAMDKENTPNANNRITAKFTLELALQEYEGDKEFDLANRLLQLSPRGTYEEELGYLNLAYYLMKDMKSRSESKQLYALMAESIVGCTRLSDCITAIYWLEDVPIDLRIGYARTSISFCQACAVLIFTEKN